MRSWPEHLVLSVRSECGLLASPYKSTLWRGCAQLPLCSVCSFYFLSLVLLFSLLHPFF